MSRGQARALPLLALVAALAGCNTVQPPAKTAAVAAPQPAVAPEIQSILTAGGLDASAPSAPKGVQTAAADPAQIAGAAPGTPLQVVQPPAAGVAPALVPSGPPALPTPKLAKAGSRHRTKLARGPVPTPALTLSPASPLQHSAPVQPVAAVPLGGSGLPAAALPEPVTPGVAPATAQSFLPPVPTPDTGIVMVTGPAARAGTVSAPGGRRRKAAEVPAPAPLETGPTVKRF